MRKKNHGLIADFFCSLDKSAIKNNGDRVIMMNVLSVCSTDRNTSPCGKWPADPPPCPPEEIMNSSCWLNSQHVSVHTRRVHCHKAFIYYIHCDRCAALQSVGTPAVSRWHAHDKKNKMNILNLHISAEWRETSVFLARVTQGFSFTTSKSRLSLSVPNRLFIYSTELQSLLRSVIFCEQHSLSCLC